jgi:hypothetical protein
VTCPFSLDHLVTEPACNYDHSRPFDVWKWSDYPEINHVVDHLLEELEPFVFKVRKKRKQYRSVVKKIVLDLYVAYQQDPALFVAYSRRKSDYVAPNRYKRIFMSYRKAIEVIDTLAHLGYIHNKKGFHDRVRKAGRQSRMRSEPKLIELIKDQSVRKSMVTRQRDEIILKDGNGKLMDYEETPQIMEWRRNIQRINSLIAAAEIRLELTDGQEKVFRDELGYVPDYTSNGLFRVFNNGSFEQGGRFYGHWIQNIPKRYRKHLRIDGEPTTELDYSGLHINMLYRLAGEDLPEDDVYAIGGHSEDMRPLLKVILLVMINSKNPLEAARAVWNDSVNKRFRYDHKKIKDIMDRFIERHSPIQMFFNSGSRVFLQFLDSQIAERVMLEMVEDGIVCLPIHDSFIAQVSHETELKTAMEKVFNELYGGNISIEKKH